MKKVQAKCVHCNYKSEQLIKDNNFPYLTCPERDCLGATLAFFENKKMILSPAESEKLRIKKSKIK